MAQNSTIVSKYGGSSVVSEAALKHIRDITEDNPGRKIIVVSAPGKRFKGDKKVTDMLIELAGDPSDVNLFENIIERYEELAPGRDMKDIRTILERRLGLAVEDDEYMDAIKAFGEEACARVAADVLNAEYVDPGELFVMTNEFGNASMLPESKKMIRKRLGRLERRVVVPGFFGYAADGRIVTSSRGSSDKTGGDISGAILAKVYENFTDSAILAVSPEYVDNPRKINELTYRESRDLSFSGFSILHHQAMLPCEEANVPIHVRSTKTYPEEGTMIARTRQVDKNKPIVGVAYKSGFYHVYVDKFGLDDMLGVIHRTTGVFGREGIQLLDVPGAIDEIAFIFHRDQVKDPGKLERIERRLYGVLGKKNTKLVTRDNIGIMAVAGEGMEGNEEVLTRVNLALVNAGVRFRPICNGNRCALYMMDDEYGKKAVQTIYNSFLK